jgi:hypothetical protein
MSEEAQRDDFVIPVRLSSFYFCTDVELTSYPLVWQG